MTLVSFSTDPYTNKFIIKIGLFPPLNVFKISTQQEIADIFGLQMESCYFSGIIYNSATGQLEINGEFYEDMSGNSITISFKPSNSTRNQYFATPDETLTLSLGLTGWVYFLSEDQRKIMKVVMMLSWLILVLGWISCILGFAFKRLSGL